MMPSASQAAVFSKPTQAYRDAKKKIYEQIIAQAKQGGFAAQIDVRRI